MKKRGQFYLVAAIIIALVIFALVTVSNYATPKTKETIVFDLGDMLNLETGKVYDFALLNKSDTSSLIENWTNLIATNYSAGLGIENWVIVYGDPEKVTVLTFTNESAGDITVGYSGGAMKFDVITTKIGKSSWTGDNVNVTISGVTYNFYINEKQNFAFLIKKGGSVAEGSSVATGMASRNEIENE